MWHPQIQAKHHLTDYVDPAQQSVQQHQGSVADTRYTHPNAESTNHLPRGLSASTIKAFTPPPSQIQTAPAPTLLMTRSQPSTLTALAAFSPIQPNFKKDLFFTNSEILDTPAKAKFTKTLKILLGQYLKTTKKPSPDLVAQKLRSIFKSYNIKLFTSVTTQQAARTWIETPTQHSHHLMKLHFQRMLDDENSHQPNRSEDLETDQNNIAVVATKGKSPSCLSDVDDKIEQKAGTDMSIARDITQDEAVQSTEKAPPLTPVHTTQQSTSDPLHDYDLNSIFEVHNTLRNAGDGYEQAWSLSDNLCDVSILDQFDMTLDELSIADNVDDQHDAYAFINNRHSIDEAAHLISVDNNSDAKITDTTTPDQSKANRFAIRPEDCVFSKSKTDIDLGYLGEKKLTAAVSKHIKLFQKERASSQRYVVAKKVISEIKSQTPPGRIVVHDNDGWRVMHTDLEPMLIAAHMDLILENREKLINST